jgi:CHASE3 domain sensor protein
MENLDIIILTTVVTILFMVLILASYREMRNMEKEGWEAGKETSGRAALLDLLSEILDKNEKDNKKL